MNRVIKFRIISKGKIIGYERIDKDGNWEWMCPELNPDNGERWSNGAFPSSVEGYIRDQFTESYDKDGSEIYEGDVFGNELLRCVVERQQNGAYELRFKDKRIKNISILDHKIAKSKIIGNIHTNPELIQEKQ